MVIPTTAMFAALASVVVVAVLGWVLRPAARGHRGAWIGAVLLLAVATLGLYRLVGTPAALEQVPAPHAAPLAAAGTAQSLEEAIAQLRAELERNPNQPEGWAFRSRPPATWPAHATPTNWRSSLRRMNRPCWWTRPKPAPWPTRSACSMPRP